MKYRGIKAAAGTLLGFCALVAAFFAMSAGATGEVLRATPDHIDFGTIDEGTPVDATSIIQNNGDVPVEITNVRAN
jgi:hypothetical protein